MSDNVLLIAIADIRPEIVGIPTLDERFCRACVRARQFWLSTDDDLRLRAALAATLLETEDEAERGRLERSSQAMFQLARALETGVLPKTFEAVIDPLQIVKIWRGTTA